MSKQLQLDLSASTLFSMASLLGYCYLFGAICVFAGELSIFGRGQEERVRLASNVFETGNGHLIQIYQETRATAQLFGGVLFMFFFSSMIIIVASLLAEIEPSRIDPATDSAPDDAPAREHSWYAAWRGTLGVVVLIFLLYALYSRVRSFTVDAYQAISEEADRILSKESKD